MSTSFALAQTDDILTYEASDEALENAAGMSAFGQAGSSDWSTVDVSGCTCVG